MTGAALLAGRGARLGAGRVYVGLLQESAISVDSRWPRERMLAPCRRGMLGRDLDALLAGPGRGGAAGHAATLVGAALASDLPCVLDADALNLMGGGR